MAKHVYAKFALEDPDSNEMEYSTTIKKGFKKINCIDRLVQLEDELAETKHELDDLKSDTVSAPAIINMLLRCWDLGLIDPADDIVDQANLAEAMTLDFFALVDEETNSGLDPDSDDLSPEGNDTVLRILEQFLNKAEKELHDELSKSVTVKEYEEICARCELISSVMDQVIFDKSIFEAAIILNPDKETKRDFRTISLAAIVRENGLLDVLKH